MFPTEVLGGWRVPSEINQSTAHPALSHLLRHTRSCFLHPCVAFRKLCSLHCDSLESTKCPVQPLLLLDAKRRLFRKVQMWPFQWQSFVKSIKFASRSHWGNHGNLWPIPAFSGHFASTFLFENLSLEENDNLFTSFTLQIMAALTCNVLPFSNTVYHPSSTQQLQSVGS